MTKHSQRRRARRSPSSSPERNIVDDSASALRDTAASDPLSGPRAHVSPAADILNSRENDLSAPQSPVNTTSNPRAPASPVASPSSGQSARESPAADDEEFQSGPSGSPEKTEADSAEKPIPSVKRKVGFSSGNDPAADRIAQLLAEVQQLRQEREVSERQIALLSRPPQRVPESGASNTASATNSSRISPPAEGQADENGNSVLPAVPEPQVPSAPAEAGAGVGQGEKFTVTGTSAPPHDPSPPRIMVEDGPNGDDEAEQAANHDGNDERTAEDNAAASKNAKRPSAPPLSVLTPSFRAVVPPKLCNE